MPDGRLDNSFGVKGLSVTSKSPFEVITVFLNLLSNGKILLTGSAYIDLKSTYASSLFSSTGIPDVSHGEKGTKIYPPFGVGSAMFNAVQVQKDGKILVGGATYQSYNRKTLLARYEANGFLDISFGQNGMFISNEAGRHEVNDLLLLPDGKILTGGFVALGSQDYAFAIQRFLPNGKPDFGFAENSMSVINWVDRDDYRKPGTDVIEALALQANGRIVAAGQTDARFLSLARYLSNGSIDVSFGKDGLVQLPNTTTDGIARGLDVAIAADGKIVVTGEQNGAMIVARFLPNGQVDQAFGKNGVCTIKSSAFDFATIGTGLVLLTDGGILATGYGAVDLSGKILAILTKLNAAGSIDPSFGIKTFDFNSRKLVGASLDINLQADGKILLAGYSAAPGSSDAWQQMTVARLMPNGTFDAIFGKNGIALASFGSPTATSAALAISPNGSIVAAGVGDIDKFSRAGIVARFLAGPTVGLVNQPQAIEHAAVYPNPIAQGTTAFTYAIPDASTVKIDLLDLQGKNIASLLNAWRSAGEHQEQLMLPNDLPEGMYLLNVTALEGNKSVKIMVNK